MLRRKLPGRLGCVLTGLALFAGACGQGEPAVAPELQTTLAEVAAADDLIPTTTTVPAVIEEDTDPNTFYVSPDLGNDENTGQTPDEPWQSFQVGLDALQPGQTLYLLDGTYVGDALPGQAHFVVRVSGTETDWLKITAAPGHSPEIVATSANGISIRGDYVEISNLRIRGEGFSEENSYGWGMLIRESHHVKLSDNTIFDMAVGGISSVESSNLEILYNTVFDNSFWGDEQGSGISIWHSVNSGLGPAEDGYHDRVIGNTVYRNENKVYSRFRDEPAITDGNGIIIDQAIETGYTGRTLIANNVVFDNGGRAILVLESNRVDIMFNTTYNNGRTAELEGGPVEVAAGVADDVRIFNNLMWSRPGAPSVAVGNATNVELGGNLYITDSPSGFASDKDFTTTADPGLLAPSIDPDVADFRPADGSAVVDRGVIVSPRIDFDVDGRPRVPETPDIGAYEFAG